MRRGESNLGPADPPSDGKRDRLHELAEFLVGCRNRTAPERLGFERGRRRTPGLRREEVASAAGISADWYTRLEQGRDVHPSSRVLLALADVFDLNLAERQHLMNLGGRGNSDPEPASIPEGDELDRLRRLIDAWGEAPAQLMSVAWDIVAQNPVAKQVFGATSVGQNLLVQFFEDPVYLHWLQEWERHAQQSVRAYRRAWVQAGSRSRHNEVVRQLSAASVRFREMWSGIDVEDKDHGRKVFAHPRLGTLAYDYSLLQAASDARRLLVLVYVPA
ncbi:MAG: helix-turn-helix transcriptional regulator [Myxococcota bacterium]